MAYYKITVTIKSSERVLNYFAYSENNAQELKEVLEARCDVDVRIFKSNTKTWPHGWEELDAS